MWNDTLSLQGELKPPFLLERTPPKTQSVNFLLPLARRDSRSPWERLQLTGVILSSSQMWKLKWFQGSVTRWSERGQHCVTLFRWHFLRKQDKEWEEAKEEEREEKLKSFGEKPHPRCWIPGKDDNYMGFWILVISNDWFNDIFPRKTASNSQALEEQ